jgi:hypothetical protein
MLRFLIASSVVFTALPLTGYTQPLANADSAKVIAKAPESKQSPVRLTTRIHSRGMFGYAGIIACDNPSADFTFNYDRKHWGVLVLKAVDLKDRHSPYDFTLALAYTRLHIGHRLVITPHAGIVLEQTHHLAGEGSDVISIISTTYKAGDHFQIEYVARFSNLWIETSQFDWLNRIRLAYTYKHLDTNVMGWNNNSVFDNDRYSTVGVNVAYSRMRLTNHIALSAGISFLKVLDPSGLEEEERDNGALITIATTFQ